MFRRISRIGLASVVLLVAMMHSLAVDTSATPCGPKLKAWFWMGSGNKAGEMMLVMAPCQASGVALLERRGELKNGWGELRQSDERVNSASVHVLGGRTF